jgi:WD40 repeat protein
MCKYQESIPLLCMCMYLSPSLSLPPSLTHTHTHTHTHTPDGSKFCSVGSDTKGFLYDAESSSKLCELKGHKGTINACAWSPDGAQVVTANADKTVCVWDACVWCVANVLPMCC